MRLVLRPEEIQLIALGRPVIPANGGDSSSSSSSSTSTTNIDRRQVVDTGSIGVSSDSSTVNITDGGIAKAALELAKGVQQLQSADYQKFLALTGDTVKVAAAAAASVGDAYELAHSTVSGARDQQKVLLIIGAAVLAFIVFKRG